MLKERIVVGKMNFKKSLIYVSVSLWMACFVLSANVVAQPTVVAQSTNVVVEISDLAKKQCNSMMFCLSDQSATLSQWFNKSTIDNRKFDNVSLIVKGSNDEVMVPLRGIASVDLERINEFSKSEKNYFIREKRKTNNFFIATIEACSLSWRNCSAIFEFVEEVRNVYVGTAVCLSKHNVSECSAKGNVTLFEECNISFQGPGAGMVNIFTASVNGDASNNELILKGGKFSFFGEGFGDNQISCASSFESMNGNKTVVEGVSFFSTKNPIVLSAGSIVLQNPDNFGKKCKQKGMKRNVSDNGLVVAECNFGGCAEKVDICALNITGLRPKDEFPKNIEILCGNKVTYFDTNRGSSKVSIVELLSRDKGVKGIPCYASNLHLMLSGQGVQVYGLGAFCLFTLEFCGGFNPESPVITFTEFFLNGRKECSFELRGKLHSVLGGVPEVVLLKSSKKLPKLTLNNLSSDVCDIFYRANNTEIVAKGHFKYWSTVSVCPYYKDLGFIPHKNPNEDCIFLKNCVIEKDIPGFSVANLSPDLKNAKVIMFEMYHLKKVSGSHSGMKYRKEQFFGEEAAPPTGIFEKSHHIPPIPLEKGFWVVPKDLFDKFEKGDEIQVLSEFEMPVLQMKAKISKVQDAVLAPIEALNVPKFDNVD